MALTLKQYEFKANDLGKDLFSIGDTVHRALTVRDALRVAIGDKNYKEFMASQEHNLRDSLLEGKESCPLTVEFNLYAHGQKMRLVIGTVYSLDS